MATYTYKDLARFYGVDDSTLARHLKKLKDRKMFVKTSIGKSFNEIDAMNISRLLGFTIPDLKEQANKSGYGFR